METFLSIWHGFFSFLFYFLVFFLASSSWQMLDLKSPSVPSIILHLTNMHMYITRVSTEPRGSEDTFPPSPWSVSGPWFVLHGSSPVPIPAWARQCPKGLGMASPSSSNLLLLENDSQVQQSLAADWTTQLCGRGGMWGAAIRLGCSGDGKCSQTSVLP